MIVNVIARYETVKLYSVRLRNRSQIHCVPGGIRTHGPLLRRQPLCPLSYRDTKMDYIMIQMLLVVLIFLVPHYLVCPEKVREY